MRVSVLDFEDAAAIKEIKKRISIPLVADIHIDYRLALAVPSSSRRITFFMAIGLVGSTAR
jgi:(E)-4-hydroxy-3-methylbut-2-enyl-diphosphate synthase